MIKLLFVDDERPVRDSFKMVFKAKPNYRLFLAQSGQEAIQITKQEKPDLVILDMLLPDMPGEDILRSLREINPQIKIIFFSGLEEKVISQKAKSLGAQGYLNKSSDVFKLEDYFKKVAPELYK